MPCRRRSVCAVCYTSAVRRIRGRAWLLALGSGVLQVLILPSPSLPWLAWIALAPLIVAVLHPYANSSDAAALLDFRPASARHGFLLGYASGVVWYAGSCYWIFHVMNTYGGLSAPIAVGVLILFCLYLGLYHGLFGLLLVLVARDRGRGLRTALMLSPFLWVAVELARAHITGFPWDLLGTAQVSNIALTRVAAVTGVYGVSLEIALVNAGFATAFLLPIRRRGRVLLTIIVVVLLLQLGRLVQPLPAPHSKVAILVQENIPILNPDQWTPQYFQSTMADLDRISLPAAKDAEMVQGLPGLIVWPESPAPFFANDQVFREAVTRLAQEASAYVVVGSLGLKREDGSGTPQQIFNSAALISPAGDWAARYDKVHLVPFGEYVPFKSIFVFAEKLTREVGDFNRGTSRQPLTAGSDRLGVFICYESIFPHEIRQFAQNGAQVFVNISNDGWFGPTGAPGQHLNMARMRAIENRRWVLRATNTGITTVIDPFGRLIATAPLNQRIALNAPYGLISDTTFYTRHGDWFAYACAIITLIGLLLPFHSRLPGRLIWSKN